MKLELSKILGIPKKLAPVKAYFVVGIYRVRRIFDNRWVEYRNSIDLMNHPSNMEIGLSWYQREPTISGLMILGIM